MVLKWKQTRRLHGNKTYTDQRETGDEKRTVETQVEQIDAEQLAIVFESNRQRMKWFQQMTLH